jgi:ferredoxin
VFFAWLPFMALVLRVVVHGKTELPSRLWLGGWLAGVGLGVLVWFRLEPSFGVVAGVVGMTVMGLAGGWYALAFGVPTVFLASLFGTIPVHVGPLAGAELAVTAALAMVLLVVVLDRLLKVTLPSTMLKFAFLLLVAGFVAYKTGEPWFCKLCPQGTLGAGVPLVLWDPVGALRQLVGWLYFVKLGILLAVIVAAMAIRRPFCRLICPIGAIYAVFNKASFMHMRLDTSTCTECGVCRKVCPMDIEPQQGPNQLECIRCFECVWKCPKSGLHIRV